MFKFWRKSKHDVITVRVSEIELLDRLVYNHNNYEVEALGQYPDNTRMVVLVNRHPDRPSEVLNMVTERFHNDMLVFVARPR